MYYKVIKNNKIIDVLDNLVYLKWHEEHKMMFLSNENEAQAILSSNQEYIWHVKGMHKIPVDGYDTVSLEPIDIYEYEQLKMLNFKTPQQIIDEYTLFLLESEVL